MMHAKSIFFKIIFTIVVLFLTPVAFAGNTIQDSVIFESKEGSVTFNHKNHYEMFKNQNPELYSSTCGECHHDDKNKALSDLKIGDNVQKCVECHKKPGYMKGKEARGLSDEQKREYLANAFHDNCQDCHKKHNKTKQLKPEDKGYAPNTCKTCHIKGN